MRRLALITTLTLLPFTALAQEDVLRLDLGLTETPTQSETTPDQFAQPQVDLLPTDAAPVPQTQAPAGIAEQAAPAGQPRADMRTAQTSGSGDDDKDHMIACSIIYQRISDMYQERGEADKATSFIRTAYAYSQTADILYTQEVGTESAYDIIIQRMSLISDSLNRESQSLPNGDLGVIENWLGWCDERGEFVQNTIDSFNN